MKHPLRVHPDNPRYFADGTTTPEGGLKAVYLTGSHTWANLIDRGPDDPPPVFDFDAYLDFLHRHEHNFIRLWTRHVAWYHDYGEGELYAAPLAWARTGLGTALDGKPKFDLTEFDASYFDRLRTRVANAHERGIYVCIMLFGGSYECCGGWRGNPFHGRNNVNGINGDPNGDGKGLESHTLEMPEITGVQEAYVRKVMDTVNDFENVLYEISNEGDDSSREWQESLVRFIHRYEADMPFQHPVGMTTLWSTDAAANHALSLSPAEWMSPHTDAWGGVKNVPPADGVKVSILDSDHWFVVDLYQNPALGREWVWKSFCQGHHPILMEHLPPASMALHDTPLSLADPGYVASRKAMGQTQRFAERMNLAAMTPQPSCASTGYCLAAESREYLIYQPVGGQPFSVELRPGVYRCEWFDAENGVTIGQVTIESFDGAERFAPPFEGDAVLYLKRSM